jgi:hypothetical protein
MKLIFLVANNAFAFVFGDSLIRMGDAEMFFATRQAAVAAAALCGLKVSRRGVVV